MQFSGIKPGVKFIDPNLASQPEEYRTHIVLEVGAEEFTAEHVSSGVKRTFGMGPDVLAELTEVGTPTAMCNVDGLVGERVQMALTDGAVLHGKVTAVRYHTIDLDGVRARSVKEIELDHSGATSYKWTEIVRIVRRKPAKGSA